MCNGGSARKVNWHRRNFIIAVNCNTGLQSIRTSEALARELDKNLTQKILLLT